MNKDEIRSAVGGLPRFTNGKIREVPAELRAQILKLAGASDEPKSQFAKSIGLSGSVLSSWNKREPEKTVSKFKSLRMARPAALDSFRWVVQGPKGMKVSGLTISELVDLFCELEER
jgi:hypothetical protein